MKKVYTLICFLMFIAIVKAQYSPSILWSKDYNSGKSTSTDAIQTPDGGYLIVGYTKANTGFVSGNHGDYDGWVIKINSAGNLVWQKCFGGTGTDKINSIAATMDGNYICVGTTTSNNGDVAGNNGGQDAWAIKFNKIGTLIWSNCYGTPLKDTCYNIIPLIDSGFAIKTSANTLTKITNAGTISWQHKYDSTDIHYLGTNSSHNILTAFKVLNTSATFPVIAYYFSTIDPSNGNIINKNYDNNYYNSSTYLSKYTDIGFVNNNDIELAYAFTKEYDPLAGGPCDNGHFYHKVLFRLNGIENTTLSNCTPYIDQGGHVSFTSNDDKYDYTKESFVKINDSTFIAILHTTAPFAGFVENSASLRKLTSHAYITSNTLLNIGTAININTTRVKYFPNTKDIIFLSDSFQISKSQWFINKIRGTVFKDYNSNGIKDGADTYFNDAVALTTSSTGSYYSRYSGNGYFENEVGAGSYNTKVLFYKPYYTAAPTTKNSVFNSDGEADTINFAVQPIPNKNDLQINVFAFNTARPGFDINYGIFYGNQGTTILNGEVRFIKEHNLTYLSANPLPSSISGDTLIWSYTNLSADSGASIVVKFNIPNTFSIFDTIINKATIYPIAGDETPYNNVSTIISRLRGSYDPNDKNEIHNGKYTLTQLANKEALLYTVRFQNTGNDTAFTVEIKDSLDDNLDINSFEMVSASHKYKLTILDNKYCTWRFDNILLADSTHNEPASHGYISYRILPKSTLANNTLISNRASIYFDFNTPVQTNIQETRIGNPLPSSAVGSVAGRVINPLNKGVPNVMMALSGTATNTSTTNTTGNYNLDITGSGNYSIIPTKNNDVKKNNGVSAIDVILTKKHILGVTPFTSPYKIIAADVNNNKTITSIDIIYMTRLILGIDSAFPGNRLWAFIDSSYNFPNATNPFPYKDYITYTGLGTTTHKTNQTFIGVKLGDVNYDWNPALARRSSIDNVELIIDNADPIIDKQLSTVNYRLPVKVKNFKDLTALQYTLNFNNKDFEFIGIENNKLGIEFNAQQANKMGNISFLWTDAKGLEKSLEDGTEIFTLVLKQKKFGANNSELGLALSNDITEIEAWDINNKQHNIILSKAISTNNYNHPINIYPNPTKDNLTIESKGVKKLAITDCFGRTILQLNNITEHQTINTKQWNKGMYIVSFDTGEKVKVVKE